MGRPSVVTLAEVPKPVPARERGSDPHPCHHRHHRRLARPQPSACLLASVSSGGLSSGCFGPRRPILGTELSGVVEAVGASVTKFKAGDEVFAFPGEAYGCHAEYRTMGEDGLIALKPASLSHRGGRIAELRRHHRSRLPARQRRHQVRRQGAGRRCVGSRRHRCGSARQAFWRRLSQAYAAPRTRNSCAPSARPG